MRTEPAPCGLRLSKSITTPLDKLRARSPTARSVSATERAQGPLHRGLRLLDLLLIRPEIASGQCLLCRIEGGRRLAEGVRGSRVGSLARGLIPIGAATFGGGATRASLEHLVQRLLQGVANSDRLTEPNHHETQRGVGTSAALPLGGDRGHV